MGLSSTHISKLLDYEEDSDEIEDIQNNFDTLAIQPALSAVLATEAMTLDTPRLENDIFVDIHYSSVIDANQTTDPRLTEIPSAIYGTLELKAALLALCLEYVDIFSRSVQTEPALVPTLHMKLDRTLWAMSKNRLPARAQSLANQKELYKQLNKMLELGVIKRSEATHWSQVLLVPKSNNTKRMVIDYRPLNELLEDLGGFIPNICQLLQRVGNKHNKYFGLMDLTSGYHQFPLDTSISYMTAFITFMGIFEWLRVPMGVKPAANYFHNIMQSIVLTGLVFVICEVYLDDILVYGSTAEDYLTNMTSVFKQLRLHKITLNPDKCLFGVTSLEFLGHKIDQDGISFTQMKLDNVVNFIQPTNIKQLRSFIGLVNYFRDHVRNHSHVLKPLQDLLTQAIKFGKVKATLVWTSDAEHSFQQIKDSINACPQLYFLNEKAPIYLHTDASDYAIGAYLFQIVNEKEQPIRFMSKSLSKSQLNWSTIEKEAYAIWYSLKKFNDLLQGMFFTLRTDHRNLTFINNKGSPKVQRWKIDIQAYNMVVEHIQGVDNIPADCFSRLIPKHEPLITHNLCVLYNKDQEDVLSKFHGHTPGHFGINKTVNLMQQAGYNYPGLREHITEYIRNCPCCQKMSYIRPVIHTTPYVTSTTEPMRRLNIDTIGPLPPDNEGNKYIIVIIDTFSRYVTLHAGINASGDEAAIALHKHICTFGIPSSILTDNGSQFINQIITKMTELYGIEHNTTTAYSKEENGLVERANKEVNRHLRDIIFDIEIKNEWAIYLPMVQRLMNSSNHIVLGVSPHQLIFGHSVDLQRGLIPTLNKEIQNKTKQPLLLRTWVDDLLHKQQHLVRVAQQAQIKYHTKELANRIITKGDNIPTVFPINSYVLVRYPPSKQGRGPPTKFHSFWRGPYKVESITGETYRLLNLVTGDTNTFHVTQLKQFIYNGDETIPLNIARKDHDEYIVEAILNHRFNHTPTEKGLYIQVKWEGFDEPTWEPRENFIHVEAFHEYCLANKLTKFIPQSHRKYLQQSQQPSDTPSLESSTNLQTKKRRK